MRFSDLRMYLLVGLVDPAVHFAKSDVTQLEGILEINTPCCIISLQSSCILLSQYKSPSMVP